MSRLEEDDLMKDIPGEKVTRLSSDKPFPEVFDSIWDCPMIDKKTFDDGSPGWICGYCNSEFKQLNASKCTFHVGQVKGMNVRICTGIIPHDHTIVFRRMIERSQVRRSQLKAQSDSFHSEQDRHDSAAFKIRMARKSGKKRRAAAQKAAAVSKATSEVTAIDGNSASGHFIGQPFSGPRPNKGLAGWLETSKGKQSNDGSRVQMKLATGLPNPEGDNRAVTQVARFLIDTGKPLLTVEDPLFRRMCLSFRAVGRDFKFPNRQQLADEFLPAHAEARLVAFYERLGFEAEIFGTALFGDGATIKRVPLINILASGGNCPSGLLEIVDCSKHMASGGKKSADYISGLMKPHVEKIGNNLVDLFIFDGAANVQKAGRLMAIDYPRTTCIHGGEHLVSLFLGDICKMFHVTLLTKLYR